jgi:Uma2 family endonuclease
MHLQPTDVRLVVEISDTTLAFDRITKARLYARAGIIEYWVVDVTGRRILVHRNPQGDAYVDIKAYGQGESIQPLSAPGKSFLVDEAFPVG